MPFFEPLPGTARHQALLRTIVDACEHDERVLAIGVLGSIGRGTWDEWSDLDLDIVTAGEVDAVAEGHRLGGPDALVLPTRPGEVDMVLPSLEEFSIRYHPLGTTNAHIVDDLKIISGALDRDQIVAAGLSTSRPPQSLELIASEALRFSIGVHIRRRRHVWQAVWLLDEVRARLMELFATARGLPRGRWRSTHSPRPSCGDGWAPCWHATTSRAWSTRWSAQSTCWSTTCHRCRTPPTSSRRSSAGCCPRCAAASPMVIDVLAGLRQHRWPRCEFQFALDGRRYQAANMTGGIV